MTEVGGWSESGTYWMQYLEDTTAKHHLLGFIEFKHRRVPLVPRDHHKQGFDCCLTRRWLANEQDKTVIRNR